MLFNSYQFLFLFFPLVLCSYFTFGRYGSQWRRGTLLIASFCFYAWWDVRFVPLLGGSILVNYVLGGAIATAVRESRPRSADAYLVLGLSADLGVLGVFKYAHFFLANFDYVAGTNYTVGAILLPLGISFFTFEQIGFLVDQRRGRDYPIDVLSYAVFVSFFPRLVAGPILRYNEIAPQIAAREQSSFDVENLSVGLTIFFIGLVKKAVLADGIAAYVAPVFGAASKGAPVDFFFAWGGVLAYTCQLYFDFSGYSDMAIGAARCFGIRLPMNFFSPYKSTNVIEFWRTWHITLSRFLRDYLYISLGGNRRGTTRRYLNLLITMLLGGLWHGANWTFVAWGGLHGLYLIINHGWIAIADRRPMLRALRNSRLGSVLGFGLTFPAIVVAWVFFRAPSFQAAIDLLAGMVGRHGVLLPGGLAFALHPVQGLLKTLGIGFGLTSGSHFLLTLLWVAASLCIILLFPSTQELLANYAPVLDVEPSKNPLAEPGFCRFRWSPSPRWATAIGVLAFLGVISITHVSEFLYWQF